MKRLLIANRGEIALRIARTAHRMNLETVAVYSDADANAPHVRAATFAVRIGAAPSRESYANAEAVLAAASASGADALHPGYGFLAENAEFAEACAAAGVTFVGPSPATMRALGDKSSAKRLLADSGVPLLPGYDGADQSDAVLAAEAARLGAPLMIKASAGGGGRGMRLVTDLAAFETSLASARSEALASFGSADVLLERAVLAPRHVEVQIFGDRFGSIVHLGERDCSVQRRHQKLIEESPSPAVDAALRERLVAAALAVARVTSYENAGTVEFLLDADGAFFFIEVNARLQVEHPVTEALTGLDLVEWQLRVARGEGLPRRQDEIRFAGYAIEARLCAEDPDRDFLPQAGVLGAWRAPSGVRVDHALERGIAVSPFYDSMIAKIVAWGPTRDDARDTLASALASTVALGLLTNRDALIEIVNDETFARGEATTALLTTRVRASAEPDGRHAALAAALRYRSAASAGRFGDLTGWSTTQHPGTAVRLVPRAGGDERTFVVTGSASRCVVRSADGDRTIAFADGNPLHHRTAVRVALDGEPWTEIDALIGVQTVEFSVGDISLAFDDVTACASQAEGTTTLDGSLRAPMSGRVIRLDAVRGAAVESGATLLVIEAMKMEHHLTAPIDLVVSDVGASIGDQVETGNILLTYDLRVSAV